MAYVTFLPSAPSAFPTADSVSHTRIKPPPPIPQGHCICDSFWNFIPLNILRVSSSTFFQSHFHGAHPLWPSVSKQNKTAASLPLHFLAVDLVYASLGAYAPQPLTSWAADCLFVTFRRLLAHRCSP